MKPAFLAAGAVLLAIVLAGCSSAPPAGPVVPPMEDGKYVIQITPGMMFNPMQAKVPVNSTVVWVSNDLSAHDVSAVDDSWSSYDAPPAGFGRQMGKGDRFEHTFTAPGVVEYECRIHSSTGMKATLTVA